MVFIPQEHTSAVTQKGTLKLEVRTSPVIHDVEYTKEQHLYRILVPLAHILLTFCIRIGTFDRSRVFGCV